MKALRHFLLSLVLLLGCAGCLQIEKIVKLKPDGSGTIEETLVMSKSAIEGLKQMASGLGGDKTKEPKPFNLLDETKLKEAATKMGEGVTFVSATKIENGTGEGFKAIYAFTDINKLKLDQNPSGSMPSSGNLKASDDKQEPITFRFAKGAPATLAITMSEPELKPKKEQPEGMEEMAMQMMQQMFKDMKMNIAVEVDGAIKETNAEYRDGARVTLMEMDFNKLLADPVKFKAVAKANPQTVQEAKKMMKGLDGVKIESATEVKIQFE